MNDSSDNDSEMIIFTEVLKLPAEVRSEYLDEACAGDAALRKRVEEIISAHEDAGDFLEEPLKGLAPEYGALGVKVGDRIGHYRVIQKIGEGGCGVVFRAQQQEPLKREVALKIIKPGMDTTSVITRFEAERQALAVMDHPNIAKVFDAGATDEGRPFFVMELVRGSKLTTYCDEHALDTKARLELFVLVCGAVQHAHQKGVIHRDLKPSNILVTTTDDGPLPKVIDFGIAKATTGQRLTDSTVFTAVEMLVGTPAYMSPEQAALTNVDVDTRTDIYSLGVLLYELLTGSTPFDVAKLLPVGLDEIRRVIREEEPARPSTRLSKMTAATLAMVAAHRRAEPPRLIRAVRGDLDRIAMRAMEKEPAHRYETASSLAMDVKRFLADEPILARPPSRLYRFQKILIRNKLLFGGIGVVSALLLASLIIVSTSLTRERQAHREAESDKQKAVQVTKFLEDMLHGVGPDVALGRDTTMLRQMLDRTAERIGRELGDQPGVEAQLRTLVGTLYFEMGNYQQAEQMHRAALAIHQRLSGADSPVTAASLNDLGLVLAAEGEQAEAEQVHAQALAIRRRHFGNESAEVATSLNNLASVYRQRRRTSEAKALTEEALGIRRRLFGNESLEVADALRNLSIILGDEGQWADAEKMARDVLSLRRELLDPEHPWVASALTDVAWAAGGRGKLEEAAAMEQEALAIRRKILPEEHPDVAKALYLVGDRMRQQGKLNEAQPVLRAALSLQRKLLGAEHPDLVATLRGLASTLKQEGEWAEAEAMYREVLALRRKRAGGPDAYAVSEISGLFRALREQRKFQEAEQLLADALTPDLLRTSASVELLKQRVDFMGRQGRWKEAAADVTRWIEYQPDDHYAYLLLAPLLVVTQDRSAYDALCLKAAATFTNTTNPYSGERIAVACLLVPDSVVELSQVDKFADTALTLGSKDPGALPFFRLCKAWSNYRLKRYSEALTLAEKSLDKTPDYSNASTCAILAMTYWQLGRQAEAQAMLEKGNRLAPTEMPNLVTSKSGDSWVAWLISHIALTEAKALLSSPPPEKSAGKP